MALQADIWLNSVGTLNQFHICIFITWVVKQHYETLPLFSAALLESFESRISFLPIWWEKCSTITLHVMLTAKKLCDICQFKTVKLLPKRSKNMLSKTALSNWNLQIKYRKQLIIVLSSIHLKAGQVHVYHFDNEMITCMRDSGSHARNVLQILIILFRLSWLECTTCVTHICKYKLIYWRLIK